MCSIVKEKGDALYCIITCSNIAIMLPAIWSNADHLVVEVLKLLTTYLCILTCIKILQIKCQGSTFICYHNKNAHHVIVSNTYV